MTQAQEAAQPKRRRRRTLAKPKLATLLASLEHLRRQGVPFVRTDQLQPWRENPRLNSQAIPAVMESMLRFGWTNPLLVRHEDLFLEAGHTRLAALEQIRSSAPPELQEQLAHAPVVRLTHSEKDARLYALADNRLGEIAQWDVEALPNVLLEFETDDLVVAGWDDDAIAAVLGEDDEVPAGTAANPYRDKRAAQVTLAQRFGVPPFSVLDARQGYWQDRKRAWMAMGIRSEEGREDKLLADAQVWMGSGTSIFDPVLAELLYRWFCPPGGQVLDPFAGGSVRGVVAALLGRRYTGVDLRPEQVGANQRQARAILGSAGGPRPEPISVVPDFAPKLTPVQAVTHAGMRVWLKRDDAFAVGGVQGGKVRTCYSLATTGGLPEGLVTAGSRSSPQVNIVAHVARALGIPCRVHTPEGALSAEVLAAQAAGAEVVQHRAGYNTVIVKRAREDAEASGWREIPFGMECQTAVDATAAQVESLVKAEGVERLVVPVGSGMSLAGVLHGLLRFGLSIPVLGVVVGADPTDRLNQYAPDGWANMVELVQAAEDYHEAVDASVGDVLLDPHYEAKCLRHLEAGDCLWIVGIRQTTAHPELVPSVVPSEVHAPEWIVGDSREVVPQLVLGQGADFVMSCPPYADLEVYSDDPRDLSTMSYDEFRSAHQAIIAKAVAQLREDRFCAWTVGEVRDKEGFYRGLVPDTIRAFEAAGARFYAEFILVTPTGSLPVRSGRVFDVSRKPGRSHQNVLVFVKGDPKRATAAVGQVERGIPLPEPEGE